MEKKTLYHLGSLFHTGKGAQADLDQAIRYWEAAATRPGVCKTRSRLCGTERWKLRPCSASLEIAAKLGFQRALDNVQVFFMEGRATKADYADALRGYQNAMEEMRSPDRDEALHLGSAKICEMSITGERSICLRDEDEDETRAATSSLTI